MPADANDRLPSRAGFITIDAVKRAAPDGYALLQLDSEHLAALPNLYKARGFQKLKTFEPAGSAVRAPSWWRCRRGLAGRR